MSVASADAALPDPAVARLPRTLAGGLEIVAIRALGNSDDARDAVQETLARALDALRDNRIPADVPIEAFVYGIARHVIIDVHRRRVRDRGAVEDTGTLPAPGPSALEALVRAEEREMVSRALASLPNADRQLLEWCFVDGERVSAIAARLGEPAERVRKRKSRALERLRQGLGGGHKTSVMPTVET